jgi:hypothetical protein
MPGENLTKTLESLDGQVSHALIGLYKDAHVEKLPNWCKTKPVNSHFNEWRNQNLKGQTLIINPGEELSGDLDIAEGTYRVYVMDEMSVSKETRIVQPGDGKFVNPIYECFDTPQRKELVNVFIKPIATGSHLDLVEKWIKEEPGSCEADYYKAFELLSKNDTKGFIKQGEYFLFRTGEKNRSSMIMMKYYLGVMLLRDGQPNKAASYLMAGLEMAPTMAEFWCGLGDCFRKTGQAMKAMRMYKNAIIMGKKRDTQDDLPIILSMYEEYPQGMFS